MRRFFIDLLMTLIFFALPCIFANTFTGPYEWIAEAQNVILGSYSTKLAFTLTLFGWAILIAFVISMIHKISRGRLKFYKTDRDAKNAYGRILPMALWILTATLVGVGVYGLHLSAGPETPVHIQATALGDPLPSHYLTVDNATIETTRSRGIREDIFSTNYVPLLPPDYLAGQPVHAYIELTTMGNNPPTVDPSLWATGIVSLSGLPRIISAPFQRDGLPPAPGAILIQSGKAPKDYRLLSILLLAGGGTASVLSIFLTVVSIRNSGASRPVRG